MSMRGIALSSVSTLRSVAQVVIVGMAGLLVAASAAAVAGWLPWPYVPLSWGGVPVPWAGMALQVGLAVLFVVLAAYLPANARMARLERSHRSFAVGMEDVVRAYRQAHAADRAGVFALSSEFDAMRERLTQLRKHPDLAHLEPELLQLAAQMSFQSRDLARIYSDEKVERARGFLKQRQEEAQAMQERVVLAQRTCAEIRRWLTDVEAEERQVQMQMRRLEGDLRELLPALGYDFEDVASANVVSLPKPQKQT